MLEAKFSEIKKEYVSELGIFEDDPDVIRVLKGLTQEDQNIIILYSETRSIRKIAKIMNCSKSYMHDKIKDIREQFKDKMKR